jgi:HlyD family secretion protein
MAQRKNRNLFIWILLGLIVILVAVAAIRNRNKPKGERVTVEKAEKRTIKEMVAASGKIFPQTEVKISSDVSGEIVELYVEEGDSVEVGQVLARIDPEAIESQVERGRASVNSAKAQLANARANVENLKAQKQQIIAQLENAKDIFNRNKGLYEEGAISQADYETAEANLRALEANLKASDASIRSAEESVRASQFNVQSAEASLKELQTSLRRTTLYAPMSGIVSLMNVEEGERVVGTIQMTGTELMRIANLNAMEVRVEVSENDIPRVSMGDDVDIEVDAYIDRKFKGNVTQIANSANSTAGGTISLTSDQVTNFEVRISINPSSYSDLISDANRFPFRPGMSASVEINTETKSGVVSVPIQAVTVRNPEEEKTPGRAQTVANEEETDDDELIEVVFIAVGDTTDMVEVVTGIQDDSYIEIVKGVQEGQEVISGPYTAVSKKLKQGMAIQKVKEDELYKN